MKLRVISHFLRFRFGLFGLDFGARLYHINGDE